MERGAEGRIKTGRRVVMSKKEAQETYEKVQTERIEALTQQLKQAVAHGEELMKLISKAVPPMRELVDRFPGIK